MRKCSFCGKEWEDHIPFCGNCGNATIEVAVVPVEKKRPKKWLVALIAIVSALAVLVGVGIFTDWFGLVSPVYRLKRVAKRTLTADSYTLTTTKKYEYDGYEYTYKETAKHVVDDKAKKVVTYFKYDVFQEWDGESYEYKSTGIIEKDTQYYYGTDDDETSDAGIRENEDYSKDFIKRREMWDNPDWKEYIKDNELEDYLNAGKMDDLIDEVMDDYLTDRGWLKDTAGYTRKGNTYTFHPDVKDLLEDLLDVADGSRALTKQAKEDLEERYADTIEAIEDGDLDVDIELVITIKGRYLSNVRVVITEEKDGDEFREEIEYAFSNVNKTEISQSDINRVKDKVNEWLDEQGITYDVCTECEELSEIYKDEMCSSCYNTCAECGEYGSYEKDGKRYCSTCYYVCVYCGEYGDNERDGKFYCYQHAELCDVCGERCSYVNSLDGKDWCDDCYRICAGCGNSSASYTEGGKRYCYSCRYACDKCGKRCSSTYYYGGEELCYDCYYYRYECDKCGERCNNTYTVGSQSWCSTCYYKCAYCGGSASYTVNGKRYCYDCRYVCDECGERCGYTNYVNGESWCDDCYDTCCWCGNDDAYYTVDGKRYCYDCHYVCDECGERCGYTNYMNGEYWCEDCYDTCYWCGSDDAYYTYDGRRYCWDCYYDRTY